LVHFFRKPERNEQKKANLAQTLKKYHYQHIQKNYKKTKQL